MAKLEHLNTPQADAIRATRQRGTTDSGKEINKVVHIDEERGYALWYSPGATYSNRGPCYAPGDVELIFLFDQRQHMEVWDCDTSKGGPFTGRFTVKRLADLVKAINADWDQLVSTSLASLKEFATANPGTVFHKTREISPLPTLFVTECGHFKCLRRHMFDAYYNWDREAGTLTLTTPAIEEAKRLDAKRQREEEAERQLRQRAMYLIEQVTEELNNKEDAIQIVMAHLRGDA